MPDLPASVGDLRRAQIVAASRQIVVDEGIGALTFSALERRLAFTRGSITWHFKNKGEILKAVLDDVIGEIDRVAIVAIRVPDTLAERARAVVREMVRAYVGGDQPGKVLLGFWSRMQTDVTVGELNASLFHRYRGYCAELVRIGQERGEFRPDVVPEEVGAVIVALIVGIAVQALFAAGELDLGAVVDAAGSSVVAYLEDGGAAA